MKIIKISAVWCPGCLMMRKVWKSINSKYNDLDITELDYDMDSNEVSKYNSGKILPVVIFESDDGIELERLIGEQKESTLEERINKYR